VHLGHLAVAEAVREAAELDQVLFVPNLRQPLKTRGPWATGEQRLRMLQVAVESNPAFAVSALELRHEGPSYTIDTLDALREALPEAALQFMLGTDAANAMASWHAPARILAEYRPLLMARAGGPDLDWTVLEGIRMDARNLVRLIEVPRLEIASSEVRERVAQGRSVRYLVPDGVRRIIEDAILYRGSEDEPA
jgi:nicotinate-nucleotide adenylyltransferase